MTTHEMGTQLVALFNAGQALQAVDTLYSPGIVSIEALPNPQVPQRMEGIKAVRAKGEWWEKNHEIHSATAEGPFPHGDRFIVRFKFDVTSTSGPIAGKRMQLEEAALYTVKDGKIVQEEFFYHM